MGFVDREKPDLETMESMIIFLLTPNIYNTEQIVFSSIYSQVLFHDYMYIFYNIFQR